MADSGKKQVPLRLSAKLYDAIAAWAEDDFRSVNGQSTCWPSVYDRERRTVRQFRTSWMFHQS